jgi:hypothetical protein
VTQQLLTKPRTTDMCSAVLEVVLLLSHYYYY